MQTINTLIKHLKKILLSAFSANHSKQKRVLILPASSRSGSNTSPKRKSSRL